MFGEASHPIGLKEGALKPFVGLSYAYLGACSINESGSAVSLTGKVSNADALFSSLGIRAQARFEMGENSALLPHLAARFRGPACRWLTGLRRAGA